MPRYMCAWCADSRGIKPRPCPMVLHRKAEKIACTGIAGHVGPHTFFTQPEPPVWKLFSAPVSTR